MRHVCRPFALVLVLLAALPGFAAAADQQGRVLVVEGTVDRSADGGKSFVLARLNQALFTGDLVRTAQRARAAVLLIDETQLRVAPNSTLEIKQVRAGAGQGTRLQLTDGAVWVRSKNRQRPLAVDTPAATAAIRGTEVTIQVSAGVTEVVVLDGDVELSNELGSLALRGGEGGRAEPGKAPQRMVVVEPDNAVQWVLYYPAPEPVRPAVDAGEEAALAARLERNLGDDEARLRLADAALARRDYARARDLAGVETQGLTPALLLRRLQASIGLGEDVEPLLAGFAGTVAGSPELLVAAATARLRWGGVEQAVADLQRAVELRADWLRRGDLHSGPRDAMAWLALVALTRNRLDEADSWLERSRADGDGHYLTELAAARVAQARFDLPAARRHAERALAIAPGAAEAAALAAELAYGSGETERARELLAQGLARGGSPRLWTVEGFLLLGTHDLEEAQAAFERALAADPQHAEAYLGLGLARFARGDDGGGLEALLSATTLAPRVALYQSYLGKAYAELERFPEALAVLASAGRIDPRDPTPHLYASLIQRDLNRQDVAIDELSRAMAKNDFRAVYRSRLLLDQDQATRGASLAQLYSDVGFEAYGAHHAVRSLELDFANASAHLFAAGTLGALPDRTSAAASEFLLARILLPVSQNTFTTFNEYTSLFSRPGYTATLSGYSDFLGSDEGSATVYGGNDRYSVFATAIDTQSSEPLGPNSDLDQQIGGFSGKFAIGARGTLLLDAQLLDAQQGDPGGITVLFDESGSGLGIRLLQTDAPDLNQQVFARFREYVVGYHLALGPGQNLVLSVEHGTEELRFNDPDFYFQPEIFPESIFGCGDEHTSRDRTRSAQLAYHLNRGRHEVVLGGEAVRTELENWRTLFCLSGPFAGEVSELDRLQGDSRSTSAHARYSFHSRRGATLAVGGRYDDFEDEQVFVGSAFGPGQVLPGRESRFSPHLGLTVPLRAGFQLRAAAFRNLAVHDRPALAPALIGGLRAAPRRGPRHHPRRGGGRARAGGLAAPLLGRHRLPPRGAGAVAAARRQLRLRALPRRVRGRRRQAGAQPPPHAPAHARRRGAVAQHRRPRLPAGRPAGGARPQLGVAARLVRHLEADLPAAAVRRTAGRSDPARHASVVHRRVAGEGAARQARPGRHLDRQRLRRGLQRRHRGPLGGAAAAGARRHALGGLVLLSSAPRLTRAGRRGSSRTSACAAPRR